MHLFIESKKYKETEITPDVLENGDCIEIVAETTFDDYNTYCANGVAFRSSEKSVKMDEVRVIPNPASDIISLIIPEVDGVSKVSIISTTGQLMYSGVSIDSPSQIDLSLFPAGLYLVYVIQGIKSYTSKFVKQ